MTRRREFVLVRERGRTQGGRLLAVGVWGESPGRSPKAGIIVPTKVVRTALEIAASVAGMLLLTDATLAEVEEKERPAPAVPELE